MNLKPCDDPWDDSALIQAFDRALSMYKDMHQKNIRSDNKKDPVVAEQISYISSETTEFTENSENREYSVTGSTIQESDIRNAHKDTERQQLHVQENQHGEGSFHPEQNPGAAVNEDSENYYAMQYHQLLRQYYELDDQRNKIIQQLHQTGYKLPAQSSANAIHQAMPSSGRDGVSYLPSEPYACQYFCHPELCMMGTYNSGFHGSCAPWTTLQAPNERREGAQNGGFDLEIGLGERRKETQDAISSTSQNASSQVDLSHVLGAWYSAGYYTGRYMAEQSQKSEHRR